MLGRGNDQMCWHARRGTVCINASNSKKQTADGEVISFGAAAGEYDPVTFSAKQLPNAVAGIFQDSGGAAAEFVLARRVQVRLVPTGAHRFDDFRKNRRRGVVVEVDVVGAIGGHGSMIQPE